MGRNLLANQETTPVRCICAMLAYVSLTQSSFLKHDAQSPGLRPGLEQLLLEQFLGGSRALSQTLGAGSRPLTNSLQHAALRPGFL